MALQSLLLLAITLVLHVFIEPALGQLTSTGFSVTLSDIQYFVSPYAAGNVTVDVSTLASASAIHGFYPVTVIQQEVAAQDLAAVVENFTATDDVFQKAFMQAVFLPNAVATSPGGVDFVALELDSNTIPSGPYFLEASTGTLYMVYRLYSDFAGAFTESLLQNPDGSFTTLSAAMAGTASLTVGVPSRLYYTATEDKPLAGVRIGVKDIYDLAGVKTSCGNRAFYNLYPPRETTAPSVQRLIDAGAIIVGKQKTSQFANGESPTADWVDYHSPFSARGDGYQNPSSSSSGAGGSMGSYDWLDIAIGSDTGGSIRGPSGAAGIFGLRPSHGLVSLANVMPLATTLDTAGFLVRDPSIWEAASQVLYGSNYSTPALTSYPSTIYTYNYPDNASDSNASAIFVEFANALADLTGATIEPINLSTLWNSSRPAGAPASLSGMLNLTYPTLIAKEQTTLVRDPFYADYAAVHDGRTPFVDPAPLIRWAFVENKTNAALDEAIANKTMFMNWFNSEVLPPSDDADICSDALFLYPGNDGEPDTRNEYLKEPTVPFGFSAGRISVFAEVPDAVYPLGQVPYFANTTQHIEYLPVAVDIMAAKGCDGLLIKLAQRLVEAGIVPVPEVGRTIYGGDVLMKKRGVEEVRYIG
jgi:hypothetical protein